MRTHIKHLGGILLICGLSGCGDHGVTEPGPSPTPSLPEPEMVDRSQLPPVAGERYFRFLRLDSLSEQSRLYLQELRVHSVPMRYAWAPKTSVGCANAFAQEALIVELPQPSDEMRVYGYKPLSEHEPFALNCGVQKFILYRF